MIHLDLSDKTIYFYDYIIRKDLPVFAKKYRKSSYIGIRIHLVFLAYPLPHLAQDLALYLRYGGRAQLVLFGYIRRFFALHEQIREYRLIDSGKGRIVFQHPVHIVAYATAFARRNRVFGRRFARTDI